MARWPFLSVSFSNFGRPAPGPGGGTPWCGQLYWHRCKVPRPHRPPGPAERGSGHFNSWNKAGHRDSCCRVLLLCGGGFSEAENYLIRCYEWPGLKPQSGAKVTRCMVQLLLWRSVSGETVAGWVRAGRGVADLSVIPLVPCSMSWPCEVIAGQDRTVNR